MVDYRFIGRVSNSEITDYYRNEQVDCFITTSSSEGLPVSVMEAIGAGLPVIATDVGGMPELIEDNGILLPSDPSVEQVAEAIVQMVTQDENATERMRKCSRDIWQEKFDSAKNAEKFSGYLMSLLTDGFADKGSTPRVILITDGYPYGGEKSFVEPELREILKHFDVDLIGHLNKKRYEKNEKLAAPYLESLKDGRSETAHSLNVIWSDSTWYLHKYPAYFVKYFFDKSVRQERRAVMHSGEKTLLRLWESMKYYARAGVFYTEILKNLLNEADPSNTIVYTYWHRYTTLAACLEKAGYNGLKIITREHRYELYDDAAGRSMRQPFREVMDPLLDGIIFPSRKGLSYYAQRNGFSDSDERYHVFYLGSASSGVYVNSGSEEESGQNPAFRIVSCSSLIERKRVDLIIRGLKLADEKLTDKHIEWIHFGDGNMMGDLSSLAGELLGENR